MDQGWVTGKSSVRGHEWRSRRQIRLGWISESLESQAGQRGFCYTDTRDGLSKWHCWEKGLMRNQKAPKSSQPGWTNRNGRGGAESQWHADLEMPEEQSSGADPWVRKRGLSRQWGWRTRSVVLYTEDRVPRRKDSRDWQPGREMASGVKESWGEPGRYHGSREQTGWQCPGLQRSQCGYKWHLVSRSFNRVNSSGTSGVGGSRTQGRGDTGGRARKENGDGKALFSDMYQSVNSGI